MKFCLGSVCWGGYLERYVNIFADNYIRLFRELISYGIDYSDIANPKISCSNEIAGEAVEQAIQKIKIATNKKLEIIQNKRTYTEETIMYSTRNNLRLAFRKEFPTEPKVFFYFPIDDEIKKEAAKELIALSLKTEPSACMFQFRVYEPSGNYKAFTKPITSAKSIHPNDWGGYCAYNILDEKQCPLYPKIDIPNIAFYIELYKAGYKEYQSINVCINHLRHKDSHHYKTKNTAMSDRVTQYLLKQKTELQKQEMEKK